MLAVIAGITHAQHPMRLFLGFPASNPASRTTQVISVALDNCCHSLFSLLFLAALFFLPVTRSSFQPLHLGKHCFSSFSASFSCAYSLRLCRQQWTAVWFTANLCNLNSSAQPYRK
ncbi:hypothetical protein GQ54DRAFT_77311 [Martensiomyces pterosporus]|nr:hypothetical protein GQ54DRAFT_77311 [Martensiomyces pterosporus]